MGIFPRKLPRNFPETPRKTPPLSFLHPSFNTVSRRRRGTTGCVSGAQKKARRSTFPQEKGRTTRPYQPFGPPGKAHPAAENTLFPRFRATPGIRRAVVSKEKIQPYRLRPPAVLFPLRAAFLEPAKPLPEHTTDALSRSDRTNTHEKHHSGHNIPRKTARKKRRTGPPYAAPGQTVKHTEISPRIPLNTPGQHPHSLFSILPLTPFPGAGRGTVGCVSGHEVYAHTEGEKARRQAISRPECLEKSSESKERGRARKDSALPDEGGRGESFPPAGCGAAPRLPFLPFLPFLRFLRFLRFYFLS